ncbi:hypothetical protein AMK59_7360 [Oryctes borbonicus]|uniref:Uncharacterized protein n=1 Tax=Oryctes borbonicus TaxID=1629725 RepID=A0A0T6AYJ0_9SCAR|nr:hypothetical protein AMK59_7360 [Oryctes borbonicus]
MDPVGPWSAYASYNRLAGVQPGGSTGDLHHHLTSSTATGSPATTTTQILPGGFLSPPPVGYEVFSPLFHPTSKPAAHYVNQHRQALAQAQAAAASASKQGADGEYHGQAQTFFEQGPTPWQQNSPFGILPHESVVTTTKAGPYENFNAHFTAQSLNQLVATNSKNVRPRSPQVTTATTKTSSTQQNSSTFFQGPSTYSAESTNNTKTFSTANTANLQQTCIVTSPTNTSVSKDYRVPQVPNRSVFPATSPSRTVEKSFSSAGNVKQSPQQAPPQIQTKAQTKIYPELANQTERQRNSEENQSQSSPISYTMDNSRLNYTGNNVGNKRNQFQHSNYRHYQQQGSESDFQRPKAGSDYALSNGPDSAAIPRKQSPLQAHSQASPIGHAQSPAYPMYNSPMNSISSPQQSNNQVTPPSPLDVSVSRGNSQTSSVAYPSVITRALNNEKNYGERYERPGNQSGNNQNCWDERRKYQPQNAQSNYIPGSMEMTNRSTDPQQPNRATLVNVTDRQQAYFDNNHQVTMADLSSCRGDPMSIVKNLQQSCQVQLPEIKQEEKVNVKRRKSGDKGGATAMTEGGPPPMDYFPSPIPPPAHSSAANQQQQNGSYFDFDRWNLPNPNTKLFGSQGLHQQHQGLMVPHPHPHPPPPLPYFPPFHLPHHSAEYPSSVELTPLSTYSDQSPQPTTSQFPPQDDQPKVVVPNIEEELNYLAEDNIAYKPPRTSSSNPNSAYVRPNTVVNKKNDKISGPGVGFMNSYLKFLQGDKDSSPPPASRGNRKQSWTKTKTIVTPPPAPPAATTVPDIKPTNTNTNGIVTRPPPIAAPILTPRLSQGDPQDDPRYFPLPKERKKNSFDSSDDGVSSDDEFFHHKRAPPPPVKVENPPPVQPPKEKEKQKRKGRPPKVGEAATTTEKKKSKAERQNKQANSDGTKAKREPRAEPVPKRESSKRAAKERSNIKLIAKREEEADENDFVDSDSDPAWTPQCKDDPEPDVMMKKSKRGRPGRKRNLRNLLSTAAEGAGIHDISDNSNDITQIKKQKTSSKFGFGD